MKKKKINKKKKRNLKIMNVWKRKEVTNDFHNGFTISFQQALAASAFSLPQPNFITGQSYLIYVPMHVLPLPVYPGLQAQRYEPIVLEHCAFT